MNPLTALAALKAAIDLANQLLPVVGQFQADGLITKEHQLEVKAKVDALRSTANELFSGPEWEQSGRG